MKMEKNQKVIKPIVEKRFEYKGYPCVVLFQPMCFRCGYVGIPKGTAIGVKTIECHGGITYTGKSLPWFVEDKDKWWIGFDCGHWRDGHDWELGREYWKDCPDVFEEISRLEKLYRNIDGDSTPRSLEYVVNECKHIVDQITAKEIL